ncbi:MAG: ABC transporter permease, partial [Lachnospiraceae bacterium]|nr:ABC transporter permease [Lachnospiraceae bacterium]
LSKSFGAFSLLFPCMPVFLFAAAFSLFLYELSGDALGGTVLLFFVTLFMALFSGLFYPVSYLPSFFQKTARWIPAACANRYVLGLLYETFDLRSFLCLCLYSSFFYLLTVLALKIRQNKE